MEGTSTPLAAAQTTGAPPASGLHLPPPEQFSFAPEDWPTWIQRFDRYRTVSRLNARPGSEQVSALVYIMGRRAEEVLTSFHLSGEEAGVYETVRAKFESHFVVRRNRTFERARFNRRIQQPTESVEEFVSALHTLSEHCQFGALHDELLCDRIVVGILDRDLSEQLQLDSELTLERAILRCRQSEAVKRQQSSLRCETTGLNVDRLQAKAPQLYRQTQKNPNGAKQGAKHYNTPGYTPKKTSSMHKKYSNGPQSSKCP